jgi:hypothetical protein
MAHVNLRVHEVQGWGGESESLPPGTDYVFEVEKAEQGKSAQKGTPQLTLECVVRWPESLEGRKGWARYYLIDNKGSRARLRQIVDATGIPLDAQGGFDDQDFVGRVFVADVIVEPYEKTDPTTGTTVSKESARIVNERIYAPEGAVEAAPPAPAPQPAQPAAQAAPAARPATNAGKPQFGRPAGSITRVS